MTNKIFNIPKVAFNIFGINIYWYAVIIVLGIAIGILICKRDKEKYEHVINFAILAIPVSLICARLYYVLFNLKDFNNILDVFKIRTRRTCNIWWNNWRNYNLCFLL